MPELLIVSDNQSCFKVEELARANGFRVKFTNQISKAVEWLELKRFDMAFIDYEVSRSDRKELAALLWKKNPASDLFIFSLDPSSNIDNTETRLYGAQVADGPDVLQELEKALKRLGSELPGKMVQFRILVVEDLDSPRDIVCSFVESLGYPHVHGISSAKTAMQELEESPERYACVVTDIRMPEMTGVDLIHFIRGHAKLQHLPIIVLTAYGTEDYLVECLKAGASGFLVKPPKKKDLIRELARAYRIHTKKAAPRLATHSEAEQVRSLLTERGLG